MNQFTYPGLGYLNILEIVALDHKISSIREKLVGYSMRSRIAFYGEIIDTVKYAEQTFGISYYL